MDGIDGDAFAINTAESIELLALDRVAGTRATRRRTRADTYHTRTHADICMYIYIYMECQALYCAAAPRCLEPRSFVISIFVLPETRTSTKLWWTKIHCTGPRKEIR